MVRGRVYTGYKHDEWLKSSSFLSFFMKHFYSIYYNFRQENIKSNVKTENPFYPISYFIFFSLFYHSKNKLNI